MCKCKTEDTISEGDWTFNYRTNSEDGVDELLPADFCERLLDRFDAFMSISGCTYHPDMCGHGVVYQDGERYYRASRIAQVLGHIVIAEAKALEGLPFNRVASNCVDHLFDGFARDLNEEGFADKMVRIAEAVTLVKKVHGDIRVS